MSSASKKRDVWTLFVWSGGGCLGFIPRGYLLVLCLYILVHIPVTYSVCDDTSSCYPDPLDLIDTSKTDREFYVSSTCGSDDTTTFYTKAQDTLDETEYFCNATASHPKEDMIDRHADTIIDNPELDNPIEFENPKLQTYWQSDLTISKDGDVPAEQFVALHLTDQFLVRRVYALFLSPHVTQEGIVSDMRPEAMVIEYKPTNATDAEWLAWRYYAENCAEAFPGVETLEDGESAPYNTAVCEQKYYGGDTSTDNDYGFGRQLVSDEFLPV